MDAMRCRECGDVRWSFTGLPGRWGMRRCEICGGEMVPERRHPHRGPDALDDERRAAPPLAKMTQRDRPAAR